VNWLDYVNAQADKYGIPRPYIHAIISGESGGIPSRVSAPNTNGTYDYGLFQLNSGGQGLGIAPAKLLDPVTNTDIAFNNTSQGFAKVYANGIKLGLTGNDLFTYFVDHSGHRSLNIKHGVYDSSRALNILNSSPVLAPDGSQAVVLPSQDASGLVTVPAAANPVTAVVNGVKGILDKPGQLLQQGVYYGSVIIIFVLLFASGIYLTTAGVK
jgi:hypothetical protein